MAAWQEPTECCFVTLLKFNGWNLKTVASKRNLQKSMGWCSGSKSYFRGVVFLCCWFIICLFGLFGIWFESSTLIYPLCRPWCLMMLNDSSKHIKKNMNLWYSGKKHEVTRKCCMESPVFFVEGPSLIKFHTCHPCQGWDSHSSYRSSEAKSRAKFATEPMRKSNIP